MAQSGRDIQERAFRFASEVVRFCEGECGEAAVRRRLVMQLLDAATSVGANLEEAAAGQSKADFVAKVFVALKESRETRYWLRLLAARRHGPPVPSELLAEADQLSRILGAIIVHARSNPGRGTPHR
jgi:four helix bundle protein